MFKKIVKKIVNLLSSESSKSNLKLGNYWFYENNYSASDRFRNELILQSFTSMF